MYTGTRYVLCGEYIIADYSAIDYTLQHALLAASAFAPCFKAILSCRFFCFVTVASLFSLYAGSTYCSFYAPLNAILIFYLRIFVCRGSICDKQTPALLDIVIWDGVRATVTVIDICCPAFYLS